MTREEIVCRMSKLGDELVSVSAEAKRAFEYDETIVWSDCCIEANRLEEEIQKLKALLHEEDEKCLVLSRPDRFEQE